MKGEPEYLDPHGHHDIDRGYIWKHAQEKEGIDSCIDQCKWMQDQNISPHHFQGKKQTKYSGKKISKENFQFFATRRLT